MPGSCCIEKQGALNVIAYSTHAVLSGNAVARIQESELDKVVVTDTIPLSEEAKNSGRISQLSVASLFGESMLRISNENSLSSLFIE